MIRPETSLDTATGPFALVPLGGSSVFLLIGYVIILAASVGTFSVHGSLAALFVPMEYLAIVGLTIGGFIAGNGTKAIKATLVALPSVFKASKAQQGACTWISSPCCTRSWPRCARKA